MKKQLFILVCCLFVSAVAMAQSKATGTVVDNTGEPLTGAKVVVKGTTNGMTADLDGHFQINNVKVGQIIRVSYIGCQTQDVKWTGKPLKIVLQDNNKALDEVVVVGFATQKKINATGAVKTINDESIKDRPTANAVQSLQGVVAGLNITNDAGGEPGSTMNINIRGVGNLGDGSNSSPLILIDGMEGDLNTLNPADIESVSVLKDAAAASIYGSRAPFGVILITTKSGAKDKGHVNVNYGMNMRFNTPMSIPQTVDGYTYALMLNDAYTNSGGTAPFSTNQLNKIQAFANGTSDQSMGYYANLNTWYKNQGCYGNTNWYDQYVKNYTFSQEHNVSVAGSYDKVDFRLSGNIMKQDGLFKYANESYSRYNLAAKVNYRPSKIVTIGYSVRFAGDANEKPSVMNDLFFHNLGRTSPLVPVINPYTGQYHQDSMMDPISNGGRINDDKQKLYNQISLVVEPIKNWKIHVEVNHRYEYNPYTRTFNPMSIIMPSGIGKSASELTESDWEWLPAFRDITANEHTINASAGTYYVSPAGGETYYESAHQKVNYLQTNTYTDYKLKLKQGHNFTFLAGVQTEYYRTDTYRHAEYNYPDKDGNLVYKTMPADYDGTDATATWVAGDWASLGIFGRVNYDWKYRYLLEVDFRADAASRFPSNQRWGYFPSVSGGWNIAEEPFMKKAKEKFLDMLKIRGSYGTLGNQNTTSFYPYYQAMYVNTTSLVTGGKQQSSLPVYSPYSTSLTWETIKNTGVGLDFAMFGSRLSGSFDWYQRTTSDMVGPSAPLSSLYGASAPKTNNAALRTRGWEVELTWRDHIGKFNYSITGNLSDYKTIITQYYNPTGQCFGTSATLRNGDYWYEGKDIGEIWGYEVVGIAKSDAEMNAYLEKVDQSSIGSNWGGGDLMYKDQNGGGKIDAGSATLKERGDMVRIGNSTPRFSYSFTITGQYKWFDFRVYFQGVGKRDYLFENCAPFYGMAGEWQRNLYVDHLDYFRYAGSELGANLDSYYGRIRTDYNNIQASDRYLQDASYLRLKNIQIGFTLPKSQKFARINKVVKSARLYFSAENLWTYTKLKIFDPEAINNNGGYGAGKVYPNYRTYSFGLDITF